VGSSEISNKPLGFIKCREFTRANYSLLKRDCVPGSEINKTYNNLMI
jgi:hypothetical protein